MTLIRIYRQIEHGLVDERTNNRDSFLRRSGASLAGPTMWRDLPLQTMEEQTNERTKEACVRD
jgi:hypothetical protein